MPNSATLSRAVETATKCCATAAAGSLSAGRCSSSQALHSRALVSVSRVPKVLLETMNSVVSGSSPASVCPASVGSMLLMNRQVEPVLAVGLERLVGHDGTEVGPADADVDDRLDASPGHAGPLAGAHALGEGVRPGEHVVHVAHDVLAVDLERGVGRQPQRGVEHRPVLGDVDVLAGEHGVAARRDAPPRRPARAGRPRPRRRRGTWTGRRAGRRALSVCGHPRPGRRRGAQVGVVAVGERRPAGPTPPWWWGPPARRARALRRCTRGRPRATRTGVVCSSSQATTNLSTPSLMSDLDHVVVVDAGLGQRLHVGGGVVVERSNPVAADLAVVGDRVERLLGHGVDGVLDDQVDDVHRVVVVGVLHAGRGPQRALLAGTLCLEPLPARAAEELLVHLEGEAGVGDAGLALEVGVGAGTGGGRVEALVDLGVDPRDEEGRDRVDVGEVVAVGERLLEPGDVGLHHVAVLLEAEDQRDVDRDAGREGLGDGRPALRRCRGS